MDREQFIKNLSLGLIAVCGASALGSCSKSTQTPSPANNGSGSTVTVNLSTSLINIGDQVVINGSVLVFRIASGNTPSSFVATESLCPHQGGSLSWVPAKSYILCNLHASEYTNTGSIIQGPQNSGGSTRALKIYSAVVTGTNLVVTIA